MKQLEQILKNGWDKYRETMKGSVRYNGEGAVRVVDTKNGGMPYHMVYNPLRDKRDGVKVGPAQSTAPPSKPKSPDDCTLCKKVVKVDQSILHTDRYSAGPNAFPINRYHTLIVLDKLCPDVPLQGNLQRSEIQEMMDLSEKTGQLLIYNTFGAAATQPHQHFQGF